jgi:hypothetical protein
MKRSARTSIALCTRAEAVGEGHGTGAAADPPSANPVALTSAATSTGRAAAQPVQAVQPPAEAFQPTFRAAAQPVQAVARAAEPVAQGATRATPAVQASAQVARPGIFARPSRCRVRPNLRTRRARGDVLH